MWTPTTTHRPCFCSVIFLYPRGNERRKPGRRSRDWIGPARNPDGQGGCERRARQSEGKRTNLAALAEGADYQQQYQEEVELADARPAFVKSVAAQSHRDNREQKK